MTAPGLGDAVPGQRGGICHDEARKRASEEMRPAVTEDRARADGVHFTPHEHDVRVQRGDWVFYVRGVKQGEGFLGGLSWDGDPLSLPVLLALQGVLALAQRPLRWKVGVVRAPSLSSWKTDRIRVVHKERLAEGEEPPRRIAELVAEVKAGVFDPA